MSGPLRSQPSHECETGGEGGEGGGEGGEGGEGGGGGGGGKGGNARCRACGTLRQRQRFEAVQPLQRCGAHVLPKKPPGCCHGTSTHSRGRSS